MANRVLRDQCEHGRYDAHWEWIFDIDGRGHKKSCPGGREVTIDYEAAAHALGLSLDDQEPDAVMARAAVDAAFRGV